ncbi:MAG: FRG domain-containing protein [Brevinematales bacterium]|nr:FRG domain-containing protein [Brevinematales bacterium]
MEKKVVEEFIVNTWEELMEALQKLDDGYIFRGQNGGIDLQSKLERILQPHKKDLCIPNLETEIIREFRRKYKDYDSEYVDKDTLYAISVIRHFEGPTRLIDFSYSKYIAVFYAIFEAPISNCEEKCCKSKSKKNEVFLWLMNVKWCLNKVSNIFGKEYIKKRNTTRTENVFLEMYMSDKPKQFVFIENPFKINERLDVQQGILLCPGDTSTTFMNNLQNMPDWEQNNKKIVIGFNENERIKALKKLHQMNINRKTLFPGKDGFIKDLNEDVLRKNL